MTSPAELDAREVAALSSAPDSAAAIALDSLAGAPPEYLTPEDRPTLDEARAWCHHLATTHYENFHVATFFLPRRVRPHFESVYAFCRVSDDLGDEVGDTTTALRLLQSWGLMLDECATRRSVRAIPSSSPCARPSWPATCRARSFTTCCACLHPVTRSRRAHYATWDEAVDYSRYSANPVGRLVLMICGYRDERRALLSDKICTGLQLANFWQDAVRDSEIPRRYIPHWNTWSALVWPRARLKAASSRRSLAP